MRENDTKVITAMRRESPVYKGFQRFSALEVIRFFCDVQRFFIWWKLDLLAGGSNRL